MIELKTRKDLIRHHPYFSTLTEAGIDELAELSFENSYDANQTIILEGEIVDSVYLIAQGEIEIDARVSHNDTIPQCVLHSGDAIGLTHDDFYSQTGLRTATLKSISKSILMGWPIDVFNDFLKRYPDFIKTRKIASDKMLRMYFIKQAEPFSELPSDMVDKISDEIQEIQVEKGTVLFEQGDEADQCYLICSGEIEIYRTKQDGSIKILAKHRPWRLIGESVLHTIAKRYASARMSESGKLLILKREHLHELMEHQNTAESIIALIIERCSPLQRPGIEYFHRQTDEDQPITILKNKEMGRYYQLSEEGWFVWQHLDGDNNLQDITRLLYEERKIFAPLAVADIILKLADDGFVILPDVHLPQHSTPPEKLSWSQRLKSKIHDWRYLQYISHTIDNKLSYTYQRGIHLFYTKLGQGLMVLISVIGILSFVYHGHFLNISHLHITHTIIFILALFIGNLLFSIPHELAHGYTTKYYKHDVHRAGVIFNWFGIVAFVDTSDMWLAPPASRIIVSLAGPYTDLFIGGIFSILACFISSPTLNLFFWVLSLILYYSVFKNLNPLQETDGYYILKDYCRTPQLRLHAFQWLRSHNILTLFTTINENRCEFMYLLVCVIFQFATILISIGFAYFLRLYLPTTLYGIPTYHLSWLLPSLVMLHFILIIRHQK